MITQKELHKRHSLIPATKRIEGVSYGPTLIVVDEQPPGYQNRAARRQAPYVQINVQMVSNLNGEEFYKKVFDWQQKDWDEMLSHTNCTINAAGQIECIEKNEFDHIVDETVNTFTKI